MLKLLFLLNCVLVFARVEIGNTTIASAIVPGTGFVIDRSLMVEGVGVSFENDGPLTGSIVVFDVVSTRIGDLLWDCQQRGAVGAVIRDTSVLPGVVFVQYSYKNYHGDTLSLMVVAVSNAVNVSTLVNERLVLTSEEGNVWLEVFTFASTRAVMTIIMILPAPGIIMAIYSLVVNSKFASKTSIWSLSTSLLGLVSRALGGADPIGLARTLGWEYSTIMTFLDSSFILSNMWLSVLVLWETKFVKKIIPKTHFLDNKVAFYVLYAFCLLFDPIIDAATFNLDVDLTIPAIITLFISVGTSLVCSVFYFVTGGMVFRRAKSSGGPQSDIKRRYKISLFVFVLLGCLIFVRAIFIVLYLLFRESPEGLMACLLVITCLSTCVLTVMIVPHFMAARRQHLGIKTSTGGTTMTRQNTTSSFSTYRASSTSVRERNSVINTIETSAAPEATASLEARSQSHSEASEESAVPAPPAITLLAPSSKEQVVISAAPVAESSD